MSKYGNKKVLVDDIQFDSKIEAAYYEHLKYMKDIGEVESFEMQVPFTLIDNYKIGDRSVRGVKYIADFVVKYKNGKEEIIDIKGLVLPEFVLKRKIFETKYGKELKIINYSRLDGGWCTIETIKKGRKERKKNKTNKI